MMLGLIGTVHAKMGGETVGTLQRQQFHEAYLHREIWENTPEVNIMKWVAPIQQFHKN
jgi:hypothetical protein